MSHPHARVSTRALFLVGVIALLASCSDAARSASDLATQQSPLVRVELGKKHFVEFYEFKPGEVSYYEQGNIDDGDVPVDKREWGPLSPSEVHQRLKPGAAVPSGVAAADTRVRTAREKRVTVPKGPPRDPSLKGPPDVGAPAKPQGPPDQGEGSGVVKSANGTPAAHAPNGIAAQAKGLTTAPSTLSDWTSDWWTNSICNSNQFHDVWCAVGGLQWAVSGWTHSMYFEAYGMSLSFSENATFWVDGWDGSADVRMVTLSLPPRHWAGWSGGAGENWWRAGVSSDVPWEAIAFARKIRTAMPDFSVTGYNPANPGHGFDNNIAGVTHDDQNWYFSRTHRSIETGFEPSGQLSTPAHVSWNLQTHDSPRISIGAWESVNDHFGDLTYAAGYLFVPMFEESNLGACFIGVFDVATQQPVRTMQVPSPTSCAWIAVNPQDGLFYMNEGNDRLRKFAVDISSSWNPMFEVGSVPLYGMEGGWQGAEFSPRGNLYVFNGFGEDLLRLYGVDPYTGQAYLRKWWYVDDTWEAEGVTVWDLTSGQAPGINGQLHLQILKDYDVWYTDELYFAHLLADDPSRL